MKNPICPNCKNSFSFLDGFRMLNPWRIKCRKCGAILEGGGWQKAGVFAGLITGITIARFASWKEEVGNWEMSDSIILFAFALAIIFLICLPLWPRYKFRIKRNA